MLGTLPTTLDVNGTSYKIRTDYRDVLRIFSAFNDKDLSDNEKVYVLMKQIYVDMERIPSSDYQAAFDAAIAFVECHFKEDKPSPKTINWEKDEQLFFPAINKVAGFEIRAVKYLHWWTFLGYFQGIDRDDTWGFVLMIRQKRAKHKKLEQYEREFYDANRSMCEVDSNLSNSTEATQNAIMEIYNDLVKGGADNG